jgi:hypothetical protein
VRVIFTDRVRDFMARNPWTFAKTMRFWPHEYLVREKVDDEADFVAMVEFIHEHGYIGKWYKTDRPYYKQDGMVYWVMGFDVSETTIINRAKETDSYEHRAEKGTLPHQLKAKKTARLAEGTDMREVY